MRRFFADSHVLSGDRVSVDGPLAHRLTRVLRLRPGDEVAFFDGSGTDVVCEIENVSGQTVEARVRERTNGPAESKTRVVLYQSITKRERFEWLLEKATELGVARVVPLVTARGVVKTSGSGNRVDRWHRILIEAAEQCGRSVVPDLSAPVNFEDALATSVGVRLLPYEDADHLAPDVSTALRDSVDDVFTASSVSIFIGPEGGFEPREIQAANDAGGLVVTLGQRVLRSETAGLVALTLVMQALGELG
jgi:16S rRNA (uracil1498-N3)-methyltransferase